MFFYLHYLYINIITPVGLLESTVAKVVDIYRLVAVTGLAAAYQMAIGDFDLFHLRTDI